MEWTWSCWAKRDKGKNERRKVKTWIESKKRPAGYKKEGLDKRTIPEPAKMFRDCFV